MKAFFCTAIACLLLPSVAWAGTITAQGNVTALDDASQIPSVIGQALFDEMFSGDIPVDQYPGITFQTGELAMMLPGVMEAGEVPDPGYTSPGVHFPHPIAGGGVQYQWIITSGGAVTFAEPVTQFGLTAGGSAISHITVWDTSGVMLGQVTWEPDEGDAAFVGIDTMGVPIGLLTVGSDDIWAGEPYDDLGAAARTDTWIWGLGDPCLAETDCLDDSWSCTGHACTEGMCNYSPTVEPCDDLDACTEMDTCNEFLCAGVPVDCSDDNICTFDDCDPRDGCSHEPIEGCCLSDEDCPEGEMCLIGSNTCFGGPPDDDTTTTTTTDSGTDDEVGEDTETDDETGPAVDEGDRGCGCSTREAESGAVLGLIGLLVLGASTRRRR
jgi:MYXO-CTERM domain-containing protein